MKDLPKWVRPLAQLTAILIAGFLLAGILSVPLRAVRASEGYDQSRLHWNTKNTTRFGGATLAEVSMRISQAVFSNPDLSPEVVILYDPEDWQSGLLAASLLKPLNAVLLPDVEGVEEEIGRLSPGGSQAAGGAAVLYLSGTGEAEGELGMEEIISLRMEAGQPPRHVLLVDADDPGTALLAAPWAAYSGDLIVFEASQAPEGLPVYSLGQVEAEVKENINGSSPFHTAVEFAQFEDPDDLLFGWGMNSRTLTGYRAYTLANPADPGMALLSANLAVHGKPGPLLWAEQRELPQVIENYLWSQRAAFWVTPAEGPFHHFWVLGDTDTISFPAQSQADYAVEIGPYLGKGPGMSGIDMLAAGWVMLGLASSAWILFHAHKFLPGQMWIMKLAWPLLGLMLGPFGIFFYWLAYNRPVINHGKMVMYDRPLWLQGLAATASAVGFGATIMIASGYLITLFGAPLISNRSPVFFLGTPMIVIMAINYIAAVLISWPLFQTPMLAMFYGRTYRQTLPKALPIVLASMAAAALAMNPGMWWLMMEKIPMMPTEESILWFGVMFFTGFLAFLMAWPLNYIFVRQLQKSGLM